MMGTIVTGKVWKFGDDMNTDFMAPSFSRNLEWDRMKKTILHIHQAFTENFQAGDVIVAGSNFGCGSSREAAPANLKRLGVGCVIAESFGRIFFRNSIAIAFPLMACPGVGAAFEEGDAMAFDFDASIVRNTTKNRELRGAAVPKELADIVAAGGILEVLKAAAEAGEGPARGRR